MRVTRTYLAVPAHQERMVSSAASSNADAVFLDLEDAVPEDKKELALHSAVHAINHLDWTGKTVCVRVNPPLSERIEGEIGELVRRAKRLDTLLIPKVECVQDCLRIDEIVARFNTSRSQPVGLELMIETAKGLVNCESIASSSRFAESLHFGVGDFSASIGAKSVDIGMSPAAYQLTTGDGHGGHTATQLDMWMYPMMRILIAARANGLRAIDGPCGAFRDLVMSRSSAVKAAVMGFDGKQVIHPGQISETNQAFLPSAEEIAYARRVVDALKLAELSGNGAVQVDGKLVDYANVRMAKRILSMGE
jgi:malyl-CoA/(S)-citramalyl-CoA lyase